VPQLRELDGLQLVGRKSRTGAAPLGAPEGRSGCPRVLAAQYQIVDDYDYDYVDVVGDVSVVGDGDVFEKSLT
jgi:hypothetical protein